MVEDKPGQKQRGKKEAKKSKAMGRNQQVRNHVSDSVEYGIDKLHRVAEQFLVYPLAAVEGAIQGAARGVHNVATHKHHLDRVDGAGHHGKCKCKSSKPQGSACGQHAAGGVHNVATHKHHLDRVDGAGHYGKCKCKSSKPQGSTCGQHTGPSPYEFYSYTPSSAPLAPPPYHPAFPVPCRPPY